MQSSKGCVRLRTEMHRGGHCYNRVKLLTSKSAEKDAVHETNLLHASMTLHIFIGGSGRPWPLPTSQISVMVMDAK